jgi:hypothetical protein
LQRLFVDSRLDFNVARGVSKLATPCLVNVVLIDQRVQFKLVAFGAVRYILAFFEHVDVVLPLVPLSQLQISTARFARNLAGMLVHVVV